MTEQQPEYITTLENICEGCDMCNRDEREDKCCILERVRSRPAPRDDAALLLAADIWGVAACVKRENTEEFMEYFSRRMEEFEGEYNALREAQR